MDSSDKNAFVRIMYFLDEMVSNPSLSMLQIMDRVERNSVAAHPHLMSLQEATGVYVLNRYKLANM
jgi:hypothetical protein